MEFTPNSVTKLDAAKYQLDTAIELFFTDGNYVSKHALSSASFDILKDIAKARKQKTLVDDFGAMIRPERRKEFLDIINKPKMFFKHADQNPDEVLEYDPRASDLQIFTTCIVYCEVTGDTTPNMEMFVIWYMIDHPSYAVADEVYQGFLKELSLKREGLEKKFYFENAPKLLSQRGNKLDMIKYLVPNRKVS